MFNNILVVCIGNICRSPVAEAMLRERLAAQGKLNNKTIDSAGIAALVDKPADPHSQQICKDKYGIDISQHKAKQLTQDMLTDADLILLMEQKHTEAITQMSPQARGKCMLLSRWLGDNNIDDPYKKSNEAFLHTLNAIDHAVDSWLKYL